MQEYVWQLAVLAWIGSIGAHLLPGGEGGPYTKHWQLLCGVCLALALARPLVAVGESGMTLVESIRAYLEEVGQQAEVESTPDASEIHTTDAALAACLIREGLCNQFAVDPEEVTVSVRLQAQGEKMECVYVGLCGGAIWWDTEGMQGWIEEQLGCDAVIYVE